MKRRNLIATVAVITVLSFGALGGSSKVKKAVSDAFKLTTFKNWGIANARAQSHVDAFGAWQIEKGSRNVRVAVVDTGLDANHPDLKANVYRDAKGNYGFDFVKNIPNPSDEHGHGNQNPGNLGATAAVWGGRRAAPRKPRLSRISCRGEKRRSQASPGMLPAWPCTLSSLGRGVTGLLRMPRTSG